jgi:hypothetical protein
VRERGAWPETEMCAARFRPLRRSLEYVVVGFPSSHVSLLFSLRLEGRESLDLICIRCQHGHRRRLSVYVGAVPSADGVHFQSTLRRVRPKTVDPSHHVVSDLSIFNLRQKRILTGRIYRKSIIP